MTDIVELARENLLELSELVGHTESESLTKLAEAIVAAPQVYVTGVGRSGLMTRAIGMRLMHIGKTVYVVGEVATPGISAGDLLIAVSSSGRGSILDQARSALRAGAQVAAVVADDSAELTRLAVATVVLPARTGVPSRQHAGSLFEQGVLIVGDALMRSVQVALGVSEDTLNRRHANLS